MSSKLDEAIQDIAVKHGVLLGKDDPILIFQTMNDRLLEENRQGQQDLLAQFKEEMDLISSQWKDDAKEKAEKILNAALIGSKEAMARLLQESTGELAQAMKKIISDSLVEARDLTHQTRKFSRFVLGASVAMLTASGLLMVFFLCYTLR